MLGLGGLGFFLINFKSEMLDCLDVLCKSSAQIWLCFDHFLLGRSSPFFTSLEKMCVV